MIRACIGCGVESDLDGIVPGTVDILWSDVTVVLCENCAESGNGFDKIAKLVGSEQDDEGTYREREEGV